MSWFKVDDQAHSHQKLVAAGVRAVGLWAMAGSWCSAQGTDGFVPDHMLQILGGTKRDADRLVQVALWEKANRTGNAGYQFHDWADYNPTADQISRRREQWRARQDRARGKTPTAPVTDIRRSK